MGSLIKGVGEMFGGGGSSTSVGGDVGGIGNSRSAQETNNKNETTNNDYRRAVAGGAGQTASEGGTINYTTNTMDKAALDLVDAVIGKTFANQTATSNQVAAAYSDAKGRGALTDYIVLAGLGAVVVVAYFATRKG